MLFILFELNVTLSTKSKEKLWMKKWRLIETISQNLKSILKTECLLFHLLEGRILRTIEKSESCCLTDI